MSSFPYLGAFVRHLRSLVAAGSVNYKCIQHHAHDDTLAQVMISPNCYYLLSELSCQLYRFSSSWL